MRVPRLNLTGQAYRQASTCQVRQLCGEKCSCGTQIERNGAWRPNKRAQVHPWGPQRDTVRTTAVIRKSGELMRLDMPNLAVSVEIEKITVMV